ncbi:MAG: tRNA (adenosine(37)-N6)-threonylcarbamoyltransferase complex dimerization subunit type 1 TsaB, partial [Ectothiorhodospiraceae bacterium]
MSPHGPWLAVDTATDACSVALETSAGIAGRFEIAPRGHAGRLLELLDETLAEAGVRPADLGVVVWCHGPGAFTGVRVAAGVAQGIAWAHALPAVGVSTLATVAQGVARRRGITSVRVAMDARMGE